MSNTQIDTTKKELRRRLKAIRKAIPEHEREQIDATLIQQVLDLPEWRDATVILPYLSFGTEVETRGIIRAAWEAEKTVALPWCVPGSHDMRWYCITNFEGLVKSSLGVEEPKPDPANELEVGKGENALVLVPGLTFDVRGFRTGYGGGFYDTFLAGFDGVSVGLCRECQLSDDLCALGVIDVHDRAAQIVVTERRVIRQVAAS